MLGVAIFRQDAAHRKSFFFGTYTRMRQSRVRVSTRSIRPAGTVADSSARFEQVLAEARKGGGLGGEDILFLLGQTDSVRVERLFAAARRLRQEHFDDRVFLYGFVYFSTYCRNDCAFCQHRRSSSAGQRYRKTAADILGAYEPYRNNGMINMPQVFADGVVLPVGDPLRQFASPDGWNQVPVMLGTNRDESRLFMFADPRWVTRYFWIVPRLQDEALYVATADLMAKQWKATGADQPAAAMRGVEDDVYVYRFDWDEQPRMLGADLSTMLGAAHAFEIPFVFGHFNLGRQADVMWTDANSPGREQLSAAMMEYWANFARTGKPGSAAGVEWLAWDPSSPTAPKYVVLDTPAGGGIRMAHETQTVQSVLDAVATDPRLVDARARCVVYHDLAQWARGLRRAEYDALAACKEYPFDQYPWS